ncbi:MAG: four helix bundle protein [Candidatus Moranbacteria bacterium]|jgi:four helix bundle protein|nr:four helix bundle protein [Candidatus Moranbacteria bacterium]
MNEKKTIETFTDLLAWQKNHEFVMTVYAITKKFPKDEIYGLVSQMRRSAVSITSNITEGFGRQGMKEKVNFYYIAQGSLNELKNQLLIAKDLNYLAEKDFVLIAQKANEGHALLQGLIKKSKEFLNHKS